MGNKASKVTRTAESATKASDNLSVRATAKAITENTVDPGEFGPVFEAEAASINKRREAIFGLGSKMRSQVKVRFFQPPLSSNQNETAIGIRSANDDEADLAMSDLSGIAISGGGVRSAAFSIGALQAMDAIGTIANKEGRSYSAFEKMDYMSTVSGGGYTGSCISASMKDDGAEFPFPSILKKTEPDVLRHVRDHSNYLFPRGGLIEKSLNLASYLRGIFANLPAIVLVFSLAVLATVLLKGPWPWAGGLIELKNSNIINIANFLLGNGFEGNSRNVARGFFQGTIVACIFFVIGMVIWAGKRSWLKSKKDDYVTSGSRFWRYCILILIGIFVLELQPKMIFGLQEQYCANVVDMDEPNAKGSIDRQTLYAQANCEETGVSWKALPYSDRQEIARINKQEAPARSTTGLWSLFLSQVQNLTGSLTVLAGAFAAFKGLAGGGDSNTAKQPSGFSGLIRKYSSTVIALLIGLLLPLLLWLGYLYFSFWSLPGKIGDNYLYSHAPSWLVAAGEELYLVYALLALASFLVTWYIGANENSPHNLYRDRLASAFLVSPVRRQKADRNEIGLKSQKPLKLSDISEINSPFHLINAALNIQNSAVVNGRGRNAGFFTFSRSHVGSFETGYVETEKLEKVEKSFKLASAMAISAAAASTAMGGLTRKPLAFTLALLNVRMGYWFPNPKILKKLNPSPVRDAGGAETPEERNARYFFSEAIKGRSTSAIALYKEITNDLTETGNRVYLTDGGHIENLGLYSLLKRRCKFIVVIDGEADPELNFSSFKTAQRFARIDLGTRINLPVDQILKSTQAAREQIHGKSVGKRVVEFSRKARDEKQEANDTIPLANRVQCAIGSVNYPIDENNERQDGVIVYIKSSLSGGENDYVLEYARKNPAFPHETTGDQFFSEEQFEAYRALGFHIMHHALMGKDKVQSGARTVTLNSKSQTQGSGKMWDDFMGELDSRYPV